MGDREPVKMVLTRTLGRNGPSPSVIHVVGGERRSVIEREANYDRQKDRRPQSQCLV